MQETELKSKGRKLPKQKPGRSEQDVGTPPEFLSAVRKRIKGWHMEFKEFAYDLAANHDNHVVTPYFTEEEDSLIQPWHEIKGYCWLNPPYSDITPWVQKCVLEAKQGAHIFCLVPASTGSNWWRDYVDKKCWVHLLNGRLTFVGHKTPYPKDLALLVYTYPFVHGDTSHYFVWNWKRDI